MFSSLLVANRGEIACRVIRTARRMGLRTVAVHSDADRQALHVRMADTAIRIGPAPARESYLNTEAIIQAARSSGAQAVHPGYGFLSEKAEFAEACAKAGLVFVGPPPAAIRAMGLKDAAKALMVKAGVPVVPGYHGEIQALEHLAAQADAIGYPVLIKAVAGGGGKGMRRVDRPSDFAKALEGAQREAQAAFGDARVLVEKYINAPRHIEIQVFADSHGNAVHLNERDCSLQRRHQKVIEEAPAPGLPAETRRRMGEAAVRCARAIGYQGAGTVEFIVDGGGLARDGFWFMEMNTRLQVEHPVTEMITGLDLVEWQLRVAAGEKLPLSQEQVMANGHAVEVRLYAEDPARGFLPSTGQLARLKLPAETAHIRVDAGVVQGDHVSMHYDPMIAKIISWDTTREAALSRLAGALETAEVAGVRTNLGFLISALRHPAFIAGQIDTGFIDRHRDDLVGKAGETPVDALLLAGVSDLLERQRRRDRHSPWGLMDGWRIGGVAQVSVLRFSDGQRDHDVHVTHGAGGWYMRTGAWEGCVEAEFDADGGISASFNGRRERGHVVRLGGALAVLMRGRSHLLTPFDPLAAAELAQGPVSDVRAPMPGKVIQVLVKSGDSVTRGQPLAVIEAMKMEHTLVAPGDLVVKRVPCAEGDQIGDGAVVVSFEAA